MIKKIIFLISCIVLTTSSTMAAPADSRLRGRILLQVEENGEAWYVRPTDGRRMYMKDGDTAYGMMRDLGLGITNADLYKIPVGFENRFECLDSDGDGLCNKLEEALGTDPYIQDTNQSDYSQGDFDDTLVGSLKGRILLQVESRGEAWYINPVDGKRYYMPDGPAAYQIMRFLSLGITNADLAKISVIEDSEILGDYSSYKRYVIDTNRGSFDISLVTLDKEEYIMITDTAVEQDCEHNCATKSLATYVEENNGDIGINGSYFCPPDYASCSDSINSFLSPVYDHNSGTMINEDVSGYHNGPMIASGQNGQYFYFNRPKAYASLTRYNNNQFLLKTGTYPVGVLANRPSLIEDGVVVVSAEPHYSSYDSKATRGGIGFDDQNIYLVVARNANMIDFAEIFKTLGADYAMNLDGGGSTALYYDGSYMVGPGRSLPNAIVFRPYVEYIQNEVPLVYLAQHMCQTADDCVPNKHCHPTDYVNKNYGPEPDDQVVCTDVCQGPIDCGAGYPVCEDNLCKIGHY